MKISFTSIAGICTVVLAFSTTGCSDNDSTRATTSGASSSIGALDHKGTLHSSSSSSDNGANTSTANGSSGDVSSQYLLDPTGSGPGE